MDKKYYKRILVGILVVAALLRLWGLSRGDTINDEIFYAFRAIKLIDFDHAEFQTTPWEWYDPHIPAWAKITFHDHPPLVFWVQHIFIKLLGENNFAFRFPSVLFGLGSIYLLWFLGRLLFSPLAGLFAAGISAVTVNQVALSRMGLQEPYVIFFILLTTYLFFKALQPRRDNYFIAAGIIFGLGMLTKYTTFILAPILFTYILLFRREYLFNKKLWLGVAVAFLLFSPIIFYNLKLYRAVGHFDFQISYMLKQSTPEWQVAPGKDIGTLGHRLKDFGPRLLYTNSWLFLVLFVAAAVSFLARLFKKPKEVFSQYAFLVVALFWLAIFILLVGPAFRFTVMLGPFMVLSVAALLAFIFQKPLPRVIILVWAVLISFEVLFTINTQLAYYPKGPRHWAWALVRFENYNWGYNELGKYLNAELKGKMPAFIMDMKYDFLNKLRDEAIEQEKAQGLKLYPAMLVHYGNFDDAAKLWVLDRLMTYHAWPVISFNDYMKFTQEKGTDYYQKSGFKNFYFIWQTNLAASQEFQNAVRGVAPLVITNKRGERAFVIYKKVIK